MNWKSHILITFLLISCITSVGAQNENEWAFPADALGFISELERFFEQSQNRDTKEVIVDFKEFVKSYAPEENEWISLAAVANKLAINETQANALFIQYIKACASFKNTKLGRYSLVNWAEELRIAVNNPSPSMQAADVLLQFARGLNQNDQIFLSGSVNWKLIGSDMHLAKDTALFLSFDRATLTGEAGNEKTVVLQTKGKYYPIEQLLYSSGGLIDWTSVGIDADQVYAQLGDFLLNLSRSVYAIDSVLLTDKRYFDRPVLGKLENKIATGLPPDRRGYPKFTSYQRVNQIKSLYPNMDYTGGFTLQGNKVIGADIYNKKGKLIVYQDNKPLIRLASTYFLFAPERARGVNAEVSIYLDQDSIFHPGLSFQYQQGSNELALMRDGTGLSNSRFFNTYHKLDLDIEMIIWHPGDTTMVLSGMVGSIENQGHFESADYFSIDRFNEIQIADWTNPLVGIKRCADYFHSRLFSAGDLAEFLKKPHHAIAEMLLKVSFLGFVRYDTQTDLVEVNQRCYDFLDKHAEKQDYDIIRFQSDIPPPTPNGYFFIPSRTLLINGVNAIQLSSERFVTAYPTNNQVKVGKDRMIQFDGQVRAGLLTFTGSGFSLDYPNFRLLIDQIDQIKLSVHIPVNEDYSQTFITDISSIIENTSGSLFIDSPNNKSGVQAEDYPQFPLFIADTTAYVYYDQNFIQGGVYTRDSFYFSTDQLRIEGLNSVYLKDSLSFPGQFKTGSIFPEIQVNLAYREDHSLGFETLYTPDSGYAVYNGKGRFYNEIKMSNEGLIGDGVLEYLDATLVSDRFLFLPDELRTTAKALHVEADLAATGNPGTEGSRIDIAWEPFNDKMLASPQDSLLKIYEGVSFDGKMRIEPEGIMGEGSLLMEGFVIESEAFQFFQQSITADRASLRIFSSFQSSDPKGKSRETDVLATQSKLRLDFSNKELTLEATEASEVLFPENQFIGLKNNLRWIIGDDKVYLSEGQYQSTKASMDGLNFSGTQSVFDRNAYALRVDQVDSIEVADVMIYLGQEFLVIRSQAHIDSLLSCRISPIDPEMSHVINQATVHLTGKNNYRASGIYQYRDIADRQLSLPMNNISVKQGVTVGEGNVAVSDGFFLSPEFGFKGIARLQMNHELLDFEGSFQLTHDCPQLSRKWIKMHSKIDPFEVIIPLDNEIRDENNEAIHTGFLLSNQPVQLYSSFLGPHTRYSDQAVIEQKGQVWFDYSSGNYIIGDHGETQGAPSSLIFNKNGCQVIGSGPLNLSNDLLPVELRTAGDISHDIQNDSLFLNTVLSLDFFMNEKAMNFMAKSLNASASAGAINYADLSIRKSLAHYAGKENAEDILNQLGLMGGFKRMPEVLKHSLLFSKLDLKWNSERGSYQSVGPIGISNIMDKPINKLFNGNFELTHRRGGDSFTLYIETSPGSYFFFFYSRGLLQVMAAPEFEKFNDLVRSTKESKRKMNYETGQFQYYIGQYRLVRNFLDELN